MDLDNVPEHARPGLLAMNANKPLAHLSKENKPAFARSIADRYLDGEEIADIAVEYKVTTPRLYQLLVEGDSDAWRSAQSAKALQAFQVTLDAMNASEDGLSLARAREAHKSAQWQLEKLLRRLYGEDKTAVNINAAGQVAIQVVSYSESQRTIEDKS